MLLGKLVGRLRLLRQALGPLLKRAPGRRVLSPIWFHHPSRDGPPNRRHPPAESPEREQLQGLRSLPLNPRSLLLPRSFLLRLRGRPLKLKGRGGGLDGGLRIGFSASASGRTGYRLGCGRLKVGRVAGGYTR
jgi:hypothetical protein